MTNYLKIFTTDGKISKIEGQLYIRASKENRAVSSRDFLESCEHDEPHAHKEQLSRPRSLVEQPE